MPGNSPPAVNPVLSYSDLEFLYDGGGECALTRNNTSSVNTAATTSQGLRLVGFTCKRTELVGNLLFISGTTAAGASPTKLRYGFYERNALGDTYTLVASTPDDLTMFAAANTRYPKPVSVPYQKIQGREYLVGFLIVTAAALPTFQGATPISTPGPVSTSLLPPIRAGLIAGQADLPAQFLASTVVASSIVPACEVLP